MSRYEIYDFECSKLNEKKINELISRNKRTSEEQPQFKSPGLKS